MTNPVPTVPPEALHTNRRVFGSPDASHVLLRLYGILAACELMLKDHRRKNNLPKVKGSQGHDLRVLMDQLPFDADRGCMTKLGLLEAALGLIDCLNLGGQPTKVTLEKYPDLRYTRFDSDFSPPASTMQDLEDAETSARNFHAELDRMLLKNGDNTVIP